MMALQGYVIKDGDEYVHVFDYIDYWEGLNKSRENELYEYFQLVAEFIVIEGRLFINQREEKVQ